MSSATHNVKLLTNMKH